MPCLAGTSFVCHVFRAFSRTRTAPSLPHLTLAICRPLHHNTQLAPIRTQPEGIGAVRKPFQIAQLAHGALDLVAGDAHVFPGLLRLLGLQRSLCIGQALPVGEKLLLEDGSLDLVPLLNLRPHCPLYRAGTGTERITHRLRGLGPLLARVLDIERGELLQRHGGTGHAHQRLVSGRDLGGVARGPTLPTTSFPPREDSDAPVGAPFNDF